ncbi:hypothetical protein DM01DRAFT_1340904 [Hesseltinella vesiculosa]|uniref:Nucleolar protein 12 n=1 Tax=Hesseltinella vesiculosa TaxID=101127 RepID=A0A1X2G2I3_9FUNG|nr:hypothetical protein DM01DRAFT_1340904 [Hesseltinella vesiculosa]
MASVLGEKVKVVKELDQLFQTSAGPSDTLSKPIPIPEPKASTTPVTSTSEEPATKKRKAADEEKEGQKQQSLRKRNRPSVLTGDKATEQKEKDARTVFVGNLPVSAATKQGTKDVKKHFSQHGTVESIRFRSFALANQMDRKGAFISKQFNTGRQELNGYVVFKTKEEAAACAKALDGQIYNEHHLRVDLANAPTEGDTKRSVFVGGLPFDVKDEELWTFFSNGCQVERVRVVRDRDSNLGKGIGYVQFKDRDSVVIALAMEDKTFREPSHKIRIQRCTNQPKGVKKQQQQNHASKKSGSKHDPKKKGKPSDTKPTRGSKRRTLAAPKVLEGTRATKDAKPFKTGKVIKKAKKNFTKK